MNVTEFINKSPMYYLFVERHTSMIISSNKVERIKTMLFIYHMYRMSFILLDMTWAEIKMIFRRDCNVLWCSIKHNNHNHYFSINWMCCVSISYGSQEKAIDPAEVCPWKILSWKLRVQYCCFSPAPPLELKLWKFSQCQNNTQESS